MVKTMKLFAFTACPKIKTSPELYYYNLKVHFTIDFIKCYFFKREIRL